MQGDEKTFHMCFCYTYNPLHVFCCLRQIRDEEFMKELQERQRQNAMTETETRMRNSTVRVIMSELLG